MPFNGSGTFSLVAGNPVVTGTVISSTWANNTLQDISANGLSKCVTIDGQSTTTSSVPFAAGISVTTGITTPSTTFAIANTTATTVNAFGAATTVNIGAATGTLTLNNAVVAMPNTANTFTATLTGCTTAPTVSVKYTKVGNVVNLTFHLDAGSVTWAATSNATTKTLTGMPAALFPANTVSFVAMVGDSSGGAANAFGRMQITTDGVIHLYADASGGNWTASGVAGAVVPSVGYTLA